MKYILLFSLLFISAFTPSLVCAHSLLPAPQRVVWKKGIFSPKNGCQITYDSQETRINVARAQFPLEQDNKAVDSAPGRVCFSVLPTYSCSEAYNLRITPDSLIVSANSFIGFLHAKSTLEQLEDKDGCYPCCVIEDEPAYRWRGAMLDVSRHFFPISFLKKQIDVMSSYKMNRLHLHLTDAAGWRMEIKRYPRLTSFAAWRTDSLWKTWWNDGKRHYAQEGTPGAYGGYYTQDELRGLVRYAQERGITIVPEIEMPAHSEEVLTAYPELSCTHVPYKQADFCPGSVATYDFLENVLKEVMDVFPSQYIHVGGDEAGKASWGNCPLCKQKMKEEGIADVNGLQAHLIRHFGQFLKKHNRTLIGWDEIIDSTLEESSAVMVWRNVEAANDAIQLGHDVVLSPGAFCYLDGYQDSPDSQPEAYGGYRSLEMVYDFVPDKGIAPSNRKHILGIQGNLWTEYVPTESHAEYMLYPRLLAIAEIGWNGTAEKDFPEFRQRVLAQTIRLHKWGVNAFDLRKEIGNRPEVTHPIRHKAIGAKVTYHRKFNEKYCGTKETTLTDGLYGGWNYGDGRWQGFIGRNYLDVTLDLGKVMRVKEISTDFLQCSGPEIYFPAEYKISVSTDGETFAELKKTDHPVSKLPLNKIEQWGWKGRTTARYIKVEARSSAQHGGWIFADEIIVN